jgi:hypothetical protein
MSVALLRAQRVSFSGAANAVVGSAGTRPATSKATANGKLTPAPLGNRRVPRGAAGQRFERIIVVPAAAAPAGPVERGGDGVLRGELEADGDATG